jgi:hypothetical protein
VIRRAASIVALAVAGGCALVGPAQQDAIVGEALSTARASSSDQKAELTKARQEFLKDPSDANRVRLATLLAVLPAPLRNDARAMELLEPLADPASPGFGRFAALLSSQIAERQRLARELARAEREHEQTDKEREKREEALRQQLEALRSIERGILEREDRLRRRQR